MDIWEHAWALREYTMGEPPQRYKDIFIAAIGLLLPLALVF